MFKKILFASNDSENSKRALEYVIDLAKRCNSEVLVFNSYYIPEHFNAHESSHYLYLSNVEKKMSEQSKSLLENLKQEFEGKNIKVNTFMEKSKPGPAIINKADSENCDLIVLGTRGLGNITTLLISSVSNYVIHHAKCPVLLIH